MNGLDELLQSKVTFKLKVSTEVHILNYVNDCHIHLELLGV